MKTVKITLDCGTSITVLTNAYNESDALITNEIIDTPLISLDASKNQYIKEAYATLPPWQKEPPIPTTARLIGSYRFPIATDNRKIRSITFKKSTKQINDTWVTWGDKDENN